MIRIHVRFTDGSQWVFSGLTRDDPSWDMVSIRADGTETGKETISRRWLQSYLETALLDTFGSVITSTRER